MYVRKGAVLSGQLEGTQRSLNDLLAAEASILSPAQPRSTQGRGRGRELRARQNYGLNRLHELPLSVRLIREIHGELLRGVRGSLLTPGELRRSQNWIGPGGCILMDAAFVPPPPEEVPAA